MNESDEAGEFALLISMYPDEPLVAPGSRPPADGVVVTLLHGALTIYREAACYRAHVPTTSRLPRPRASPLNAELTTLGPWSNLVAAVMEAYPLVEAALADEATISRAAESSATAVAQVSTVATPALFSEYLFSHHLYSQSKMRDMTQCMKQDFFQSPIWCVFQCSSSCLGCFSHAGAGELDLGGFYVVGKPGFIVVEGDRDAVGDFVRRLHRLPWQRLTTRHQDNLPAATPRLPVPFRQLPVAATTSPMAALKAALLAAGRRGVFEQITGLGSSD